MELKDIVAITGKPGLYKVVSYTGKGMIVESIDEKKTRLPVNASQQVALLDEITVYSDTDDNLTLKEVFENISKLAADEKVPNVKDDPATIKDFFEKAVPQYDRDRVYASDMKKIFKWYEILYAGNQGE